MLQNLWWRKSTAALGRPNWPESLQMTPVHLRLQVLVSCVFFTQPWMWNFRKSSVETADRTSTPTYLATPVYHLNYPPCGIVVRYYFTGSVGNYGAIILYLSLASPFPRYGALFGLFLQRGLACNNVHGNE